MSRYIAKYMNLEKSKRPTFGKEGVVNTTSTASAVETADWNNYMGLASCKASSHRFTEHMYTETIEQFVGLQ